MWGIQVQHKGNTRFFMSRCSSENASNNDNESAMMLGKLDRESLVLASDADVR